MPDIVVEHCLFDSLDCRHIWDVRKTKEEFQIAFFRLIARLIGRFFDQGSTSPAHIKISLQAW